jgi:predicted DCC family thiol-disulfide oxidoreductase YuxK
MCNGAVRFIIANDPAGRFRFAPMQSEPARALLARYGYTPEDVNSIVLIDEHGIALRSDAALRIARGLRSPFSLIGNLTAIPRPLRDAVYTFIANNRKRWFSTKTTCPVPTPAQSARFL